MTELLKERGAHIYSVFSVRRYSRPAGEIRTNVVCAAAGACVTDGGCRGLAVGSVLDLHLLLSEALRK